MSCCSVTSTNLMQSDVLIRAGKAEVRCKNGHVVTKCKGTLKPWQGVMRRRTCGACGKVIDRDEPHWRCEEHCHWDICHACFGNHWTRVIKAASATDKNDLRAQLLAAVPAERRRLHDYVEAVKKMKKPQPTEEEQIAASKLATDKYAQKVRSLENEFSQATASAKSQKQQTPASVLASARGGQPSSKSSARRVSFEQDGSVFCLWQKYELHICIATLLVISPLSLAAERRLLGDESLKFPSPWQMVAFVNLIAALLCKIASCWLQPSSSQRDNTPMLMPPGMPVQDNEVSWKLAGILGAMHAIELGINAFIVRSNPIGTRNEIYFLSPVVFVVASVCSATEPWPLPTLLIAGFACMGIGGIVASRSPWIWPVSYEQLPLSVLAGAITCLRWIWTNNIFPPDRLLHRSEKPKSALVLASRMAPTTGVAGLELTFLTSVSHLGALLAIFRTPHPWTVVGLLLILACCAAVTLVAELRLVQISSMTLLGFLGPLRQAGTTLVAAPLVLGLPVPNWLWWVLSAVFFLVGIALFREARRTDLQEQSQPQQPRGTHAMTYAPNEMYYQMMHPQDGDDGDWV